MKKLFLLALFLFANTAHAVGPFAPNTVLHAADLNAALAAPNITGGTITGAIITDNIIGNATTATNLASGLGGQIPYQSGFSATSFLANGTANQLLQSNGGTAAPSWTSTLTSVTLVSSTINSAINNTPTVNGYTEAACTPTITAGAITINVSTVATGCSTVATIQTLTLVANTAVTLPAAVNGQSYSLLACASGGAFSITSWPTTNVTVKWAGGVAPTATATNGKCDLYNFVSIGTSTYGAAVLNF